MFIQQYLHWERAMLIRIIQRLLAELRPHRRHHHHHHKHPAIIGFIFFTAKDHHMAIITTLEIGASGVAHASFVDGNGVTGSFSGTPVWSASNADATVVARADGLTADVTRLTANPYLVTCTVQNSASGGAPIVASADLPLPAAGTINPAVSGSIGFTDV
jgi:hypothetical protein